MRLLQTRELFLDENLREILQQGDPSFPLEVYYDEFDHYVGGMVPWHWHSEIEFAYTFKGTMLLSVGDEKLSVPEGCGIFINSNQLHDMRSNHTGGCVAIGMVLNPRIISGATHSVLEQKYVHPIIGSKQIKYMFFNKTVDWEGRVIDLIKCVADVYTAAPYGYELLLRNHITEMWFLIASHLRDVLPDVKSKPEDDCIKDMLAYINGHYMEYITLENIANSANISTRECCRRFKTALHTTPFSYLLELRVRAAASLLKNTDHRVTDICFATGFRGTSYFCKVFHKITGLSPRDFRKQKTESPLLP